MARKMQNYLIYHPVNGEMNHECDSTSFEYQRVAVVNAYSLEHAFEQAQNDFNEEYAKLGFRSTSVGDIIRSKGQCVLVKGLGFEEIIPHNWLSYVPWYKLNSKPQAVKLVSKKPIIHVQLPADMVSKQAVIEQINEM